jgi:hypothetical protein
MLKKSMYESKLAEAAMLFGHHNVVLSLPLICSSLVAHEVIYGLSQSDISYCFLFLFNLALDL